MSTRAASRVFAPVWIVLALAMLAAGGISSAVEAKPNTLSEKSVRQFIASYPDVKTVLASEAAEKGTRLAGSGDILAGLIEVASNDEVKQRLDLAVRPHGFSGAKEWLTVAASIGRAYAHIKAGPSDDKAQKKVEKAVAKIQKTDFLSDKHKEKLIKQLRKSAGVALDPPPAENVAAVAPMVGEIEAVMK